jgi:hypothetical protein
MLSGERDREANSFGVEASLPESNARGRNSSLREELKPMLKLLDYADF